MSFMPRESGYGLQADGEMIWWLVEHFQLLVTGQYNMAIFSFKF
jgi:hypothetical protein